MAQLAYDTFINTLCWLLRYDEAGLVVQVRLYVDGVLSKQSIRENPVPGARLPE